MKRLAILLPLVVLTACNSEDLGINSEEDDGESYDIIEDVFDDVEDNGEYSSLSSLYDREPDINACYEGVLKESEKRKALSTLNHIRELHKLKPVTYNYSDDVYTSKSALITVANAELDHFPTTDFECWSPEGEYGSGRSNLHIYSSFGFSSVEESDEAIVAFLIDDQVSSLGHRRWLLDPFLSFVSYGRVDGKPLVSEDWDMVTGVSLKVVNEEESYIQDLTTDFIAYPHESYPDRYFNHNWYLSFSVLADKSSSWNNQNVDYSRATIAVYDKNGQALNVHSVGYNNEAFGLPNILKWKVDGTVNDEQYTVQINNVNVLNNNRNFEYWFRID